MVSAWVLESLVITPLSESHRAVRKPIFNTSIRIVAVFVLGCGIVKNTTLLCVIGFISGLGSCSPLNVVACTWDDL